MPPLSLSSYGSKYGEIPYAFPGSVHLDGLGAISDALVRRRKWSDIEVQHEILELIG